MKGDRMKAARCFVLLLAVSAAASTAVELSVGELTQRSAAVARVRVTSTRAVLSEGRISTIVECEVLEAWKGAPGAALRIATPGGELDGLGQRVEGAATFTAGEEAVVFLSHPLGGTWRVTALEQGKWSVTGDAAAPAITGHRLNPGAAPAKLPLRDLEAQVRAR
jgi:hypothetical protein